MHGRGKQDLYLSLKRMNGYRKNKRQKKRINMKKKERIYRKQIRSKKKMTYLYPLQVSGITPLILDGSKSADHK